jgi:hypothetical protein
MSISESRHAMRSGGKRAKSSIELSCR